MSEVLGSADANNNPETTDVDDDADDFGDDFDDLDAAGYRVPSQGFFSTIASPLTLAITAFVLGVISLVGLLSTYLLTNAIIAGHTGQDQLYGQKVTTALELGLGVIAGILAVIAHSAGAHDADAATNRTARALAGAAFLLSVLSVAQSIVSLFLLAGAHPGASVGG